MNDKKLPASRLYLAAAIVLVALNARPSLSTIGPVLPEAMAATGLTSGESWVLTTIPVLMLGLFGLAAPKIARAFGTERAVLFLTLLLAAALGIRFFGTLPALALGCAVGGAAIGAANVLLPSIMKRDFSDRMPLMTGLYTMALTGGAATAAGTVVPISRALGSWSYGLAFFALPALVAAAVFAREAFKTGQPPAAPKLGWIWKDRLAWTVTLFMGVQSSMAYCVFAWLAPILRERGLDPVAAGLAVSVSVLIQAPIALSAPHLAAKFFKDQRGPVAIGLGLTFVGFVLLFWAPLSAVWLGSAILGMGQGSVFSLALMIIVMRARDAQSAAALSSMAQGVGYCLAAAGPLAMGWLRDLSGGWLWPGVMLLVICGVSLVFGLDAGRAVHIGDSRKR